MNQAAVKHDFLLFYSGSGKDSTHGHFPGKVGQVGGELASYRLKETAHTIFLGLYGLPVLKCCFGQA
jgi:hypothetical protein